MRLEGTVVDGLSKSSVTKNRERSQLPHLREGYGVACVLASWGWEYTEDRGHATGDTLVLAVLEPQRLAPRPGNPTL